MPRRRGHAQGDLVTIVVAVVAVVACVTSYVTWVAGRIDRMTVRVTAAQAALDAQLVRRAAVAREFAGVLLARQIATQSTARSLDTAARAALESGGADRGHVENALTGLLRHCVAELPIVAELTSESELARVLADLDAATTKVCFAVQFRNDAVGDMLMLRRRRLPRMLLPVRRAPLPAYIELGDTAMATRK